MSNFKSGSGDLDFGGGDDDDKDESVDETTETEDEQERTGSKPPEQPTSAPRNRESPDTERSSGEPAPGQESADESTAASSSAGEYPYFVRRRNVGDERDTRLEIHVRDKVADQEAQFRNELAEYLGANEVSKTDAREFALLAAFHHPERVAELMRDEGFGTLG